MSPVHRPSVIAAVACLAVAAFAVSECRADTFLVMGDWGGQPSSPYYTSAEKKVAAAMDQLAGSTKTKFALALGDNFYDEGVTSVDDHRFKETFESVFSGSALQSPFKFHVIAGNHDHRGNVSAEVAYSARSPRWGFPSLYFNFSEVASDGSTIEFVMLDSVIMVGNSLADGRDLPGSELPGPSDVAAAEDQWAWAEATIAASKADYLVVAAHYPVWSVCENGPTSELVSRLKPILEQHKVTAFLAGHDHCAEYIDEGTGIQYHGIGAAHGCNPSTAHMDAIPKHSLKFHYGGEDTLSDDYSVGAFASITFDKSGFQVTHIKDDGSVLYTGPKAASRR